MIVRVCHLVTEFAHFCQTRPGQIELQLDPGVLHVAEGFPGPLNVSQMTEILGGLTLTRPDEENGQNGHTNLNVHY